MTKHRRHIRLVEDPVEGDENPRATWRELVRRAQAGDIDAFEELVREHQAAAFGFATAFLGCPEEGADAAQDALVKAFQRLAGYRHEAPFRTWLLKIVRNTCLDRLRSHQRRMQALRRLGEMAELQQYRVDPESAVASGELAEILHAALGELNPAFREVLVLFDLQGLSYQEISLVCGLPVGTVKSRLARGREALRVVVSRWNLFGGGGGDRGNRGGCGSGRES